MAQTELCFSKTLKIINMILKQIWEGYQKKRLKKLERNIKKLFFEEKTHLIVLLLVLSVTTQWVKKKYVLWMLLYRYWWQIFFKHFISSTHITLSLIIKEIKYFLHLIYGFKIVFAGRNSIKVNLLLGYRDLLQNWVVFYAWGASPSTEDS